MPITPTCTPFCVGNLKKNPPFLRGENFSGFFPEPFPGAITTAAAIITAIVIAITPTAIITTAATAINGTLIRINAFPFKKTFQKISLSTFL